jgi:hypothetical protein
MRKGASDSDREVVAALTPAGEAFFQDHFREVVDYTCEVLESVLSKAELTTLADLCQRIRKDARPPKGEAPPRAANERRRPR